MYLLRQGISREPKVMSHIGIEVMGYVVPPPPVKVNRMIPTCPVCGNDTYGDIDWHVDFFTGTSKGKCKVCKYRGTEYRFYHPFGCLQIWDEVEL